MNLREDLNCRSANFIGKIEFEKSNLINILKQEANLGKYNCKLKRISELFPNLVEGCIFEKFLESEQLSYMYLDNLDDLYDLDTDCIIWWSPIGRP